MEDLAVPAVVFVIGDIPHDQAWKEAESLFDGFHRELGKNDRDVKGVKRAAVALMAAFL